MGFWSSLGFKRSITEADVLRMIHTNINGTPKGADHETCLGIPALWAGFRILGQTMASLPFEVFERKKDGDYPAIDHPVYELLSVAPSGLCNAYNFKEMLQVNGEQYGNGFARIHRDRKAVVKEFEYYHPNKVKVLYNPEKRIKKFELSHPFTNKTTIVDHDEMIHLFIMSKDGIIGTSPVMACSESLGMSLSAQNYGNQWFTNGATPSGVFSTPDKLTDAQVEQLKGIWAKNYQGAKNAGNVAIMHSGASYEQISSTPVDSDFIKTMKWSGEQVAQMLGVPPHLLGILERSTNNNIEQQSIDFVVHCIRPRVKAWENEFNYKLFLTPETRAKYYVRFNLESLLRGDTLARAEYYSTLFNIGVLSQNDIRSQEHMNKIPDGDKYFVQLNMGDANQPKEPTKTPENGKK